MSIPLLGGKKGNLICQEPNCNKKRYAHAKFCPDHYSKNTDKGLRNSRNQIINARLPKILWMATNFAAKMVRDGKPYFESTKISASYYKVNLSDLRSAMSQRVGLNRRGKKYS